MALNNQNIDHKSKFSVQNNEGGQLNDPSNYMINIKNLLNNFKEILLNII